MSSLLKRVIWFCNTTESRAQPLCARVTSCVTRQKNRKREKKSVYFSIFLQKCFRIKMNVRNEFFAMPFKQLLAPFIPLISRDSMQRIFNCDRFKESWRWEFSGILFVKELRKSVNPPVALPSENLADWKNQSSRTPENDSKLLDPSCNHSNGISLRLKTIQLFDSSQARWTSYKLVQYKPLADLSRTTCEIERYVPIIQCTRNPMWSIPMKSKTMNDGNSNAIIVHVRIILID